MAKRRPLWIALALLALPWAVQADSGTKADTLAQRLVALRTQVEQLQDRLQGLESEHKARLASLAQQRAEVEANLRRARLQVKQLRQTLEAHRQAIQRAKEQDHSLIPTLQAAIASQRQRVRSGLPFQVAQRLALLDQLQRDLDQGVITSAQAASRLWAFIEDEARLARESGLYRQPVTTAGGEVLADVARIGLVALFYRAPDGSLGYLAREGDAWRARRLEETADREQVALLFESLEKQLRSGFFTLPNALEVER